MIPRAPTVARDSWQVWKRMEELLPSLFGVHDPVVSDKPYPHGYTCTVHDVKGSSPKRPAICWFGGEEVRPSPQPMPQQSQVRGWPYRRPRE